MNRAYLGSFDIFISTRIRSYSVYCTLKYDVELGKITTCLQSDHRPPKAALLLMYRPRREDEQICITVILAENAQIRFPSSCSTKLDLG